MGFADFGDIANYHDLYACAESGFGQMGSTIRNHKLRSMTNRFEVHG